MPVKVENILKLFQKLKELLLQQKDRELLYIIAQIEDAVTLINEYLICPTKESDFENLYQALLAIYLNINQPRVGLSDYFIWKDSYDERIKANSELDKIKEKLSIFFST